MSSRREWTYKDGTRLSIRDISTAHLQNIILFLEKLADQLSEPQEVYCPMGVCIMVDEDWQIVEVDGANTLINGYPIYVWITDMQTELNKRETK